MGDFCLFPVSPQKKTIPNKKTKQNKTILWEDEKHAAEFILEQRVTHVSRLMQTLNMMQNLKKKNIFSPVSCSTLPPVFMMHLDGTIEDGRSHRDNNHWLAFSSLEVGFHTLPHQLEVPWVLLEQEILCLDVWAEQGGEQWLECECSVWTHPRPQANYTIGY